MVTHLCCFFALPSEPVHGWLGTHGSGHLSVPTSSGHGKCDRREEYNSAEGSMWVFCVLLLEDMIKTPSSWPQLSCSVSADQGHLKALKFPTILMLQKKLSFILSTIKCKPPVLPTPCSQFASRLFKMCIFINVFASFLVTWGWAAAFWWPALPRLTRFYPFLLCRDRSLHFHWKPPWHKLFFYFGTYQELLHKSYWGGELELSSDFITWLKKSGCKLKLDI